LFEFEHSTNSLKSRLSGIFSCFFADFEEHVDPLLGRQPGAKEGVRLVGFLKALENPDYTFHSADFIAPGLLPMFRRDDLSLRATTDRWIAS
jgi:hypothetical protein